MLVVFLSYESNKYTTHQEPHIFGVTKLEPQKCYHIHVHMFVASHVDAHKYSLEAKIIKKPLAGRKG